MMNDRPRLFATILATDVRLVGSKAAVDKRPRKVRLTSDTRHLLPVPVRLGSARLRLPSGTAIPRASAGSVQRQ